MAEAAEAVWALSQPNHDLTLESSSSGPCCGLCLEDGIEESALYECETCDGKALCARHFQVHCQRKAGHAVNPLGSLPAAAARQPVTAPCGAHDDITATSYCLQHKALLCAACVTHAGHGGDVAAVAAACALLSSQLSPLLDRMSCASVALQAASDAVGESKSGLIARVDASVARFDLVVDDVIVKVNEYRASTIAAVRAVCADRVKALEAQADELTVSAGQLAACVAGGKAAMSRDGPDRLQHALDGADMVVAFERMAMTPRVPVRLEVSANVDSVLSSLQAGGTMAQLRLYEVDSMQCEVTGSGVDWYVTGEPEGKAVNVIRIRCVDAGDGSLAEWVTASDLAVSVVNEGIYARIVSAVVVEPGVIEAVYAVSDGASGAIDVNVSVCGVLLSGGPFKVHQGCKARGRHMRTIPLPTGERHHGFAVISDGQQFYLLNDWRILLCNMDGTVAREFLRDVDYSYGIHSPEGLCITKHGTLLVANHDSQQVVELSFNGECVRTISPRSFDQCCSIAIHENIIALACCHYNMDVIPELFTLEDRWMIFLIDYVNGDVLWHTPFEQLSSVSLVSSLRFTPDGHNLLVACDDEPIRVYSCRDDLKLAWQFGGSDLGKGSKHVELTSDGNAIVSDPLNHRICVFSLLDGSLLRSWGNEGTEDELLKKPNRMAVFEDRLFVLDSETKQIKVFQ